MPHRKVIYFTLLFLLVIAGIMAGIIFYSQQQKLKVVFFDVGQGDSILIQQGSKQILIDGGPDGKKVMEKLGEYVPFWDRTIDVVMATHPDQDHISGLVDVMSSYQIGEMVDNGVMSDTQIYQRLSDIISEKNIPKLEAVSGLKIIISDEAELMILSPDGKQDKEKPKDTNVASIVSRLSSKDAEFLFTGDIADEQEDTVINSGRDIDADILKISHHGSKYGTSDIFLEKTAPKEAVISVGKNNRYGHPAEDVLGRLKAQGIKILRTDESGDVEYEL